jgi:hypothetical protein
LQLNQVGFVTQQGFVTQVGFATQPSRLCHQTKKVLQLNQVGFEFAKPNVGYSNQNDKTR